MTFLQAVCTGLALWFVVALALVGMMVRWGNRRQKRETRWLRERND